MFFHYMFISLYLLFYILTIFISLSCAYLFVFIINYKFSSRNVCSKVLLFFQYFNICSNTCWMNSNAVFIFQFDPTIFELKEFENDSEKRNALRNKKTKWLKQPKKLLSTSSIKRRIVVSREFDKAIQDIVDELLKYYVFSWYKPLIKHDSYSSQCLLHLNDVFR